MGGTSGPSLGPNRSPCTPRPGRQRPPFEPRSPPSQGQQFPGLREAAVWMETCLGAETPPPPGAGSPGEADRGPRDTITLRPKARPGSRGGAGQGRFQNGRRHGRRGPFSSGEPRSRAGGVGRRELGWVGGRGEPERGERRAGRGTKGPFVTRAGAQGAHYPMPRSHVGNKRPILCPGSGKTTRGPGRRGEIFNPMGAGRAQGPRGPPRAVGRGGQKSRAVRAASRAPAPRSPGPRLPTWPLGPGPAASGPGTSHGRASACLGPGRMSHEGLRVPPGLLTGPQPPGKPPPPCLPSSGFRSHGGATQFQGCWGSRAASGRGETPLSVTTIVVPFLCLIESSSELIGFLYSQPSLFLPPHLHGLGLVSRLLEATSDNRARATQRAFSSLSPPPFSLCLLPPFLLSLLHSFRPPSLLPFFFRG